MYTLRFPFRLPPNSRIGPDEVSKHVGPFELSLKEVNNLYVLKVRGLLSEVEAKAFIANIRTGLAWLLLKYGIPADADFELQTTQYFTDPEKVAADLSKASGGHVEPADGAINELSPAVYLTGKRIQVWSGVPETMTTHFPLGEFVLDPLSEGVMFPASKAFAEDHKLTVALDLYGAYFTEKSSNARFLTLIMALEVLAVDVERSTFVLELLDQWGKQVSELRKTVEPKSEDAQSLDDIGRQILHKRVSSKRGKIRNLVLFTLQDVAGVDAVGLAKKARDLYDLRSTLVHEGSLDPKELGRAIEDGNDIVRRVLMTRFQKLIGVI
jgi:hypothetical protein